MPSQSAAVGGLDLPLAAGTIATATSDPVVVGLLDYLAHWLNWGLNTRLAVQVGTSATAVPTANRFPYDPSKVFVRKALPALYVWRTRTDDMPYTTVKNKRVSTVNVAWIWQELVTPNGIEMRAGLLNAADALFSRAVQTDRHATWPASGSPYFGVYPTGACFGLSLGLEGWERQRGATELGALWEVPAGDGTIERGFPALRTAFLVHEIVEGDSSAIPDDLMTDMDVDLRGGSETSESTTILERVMPAPDGTHVGE